MPNQELEHDEMDQASAMYIAMVVRNAMEDFHSDHLSDVQMKELNPIIRDAIYTALHTLRQANSSPAAKKFVNFQASLIPDYWEQPEFLKDYLELALLYDTSCSADDG